MCCYLMLIKTTLWWLEPSEWSHQRSPQTTERRTQTTVKLNQNRETSQWKLYRHLQQTKERAPANTQRRTTSAVTLMSLNVLWYLTTAMIIEHRHSNDVFQVGSCPCLTESCHWTGSVCFRFSQRPNRCSLTHDGRTWWYCRWYII